MKQNKIIKESKKIIPFLGVLGVVLILFMLLTKFMVGAIMLALCIIIPFITGTFNLRMSGVEMATLTTLVFGMAFGPVVGALIGFFTILFQLFLGKYINTYILWVIPSYVLLGFTAGIISGDIATVGVIMMFIMHIFFVICTAIVSPAGLPKFFPYLAMSTLVNYFLISKLGPILLNLMV